MGQDEGRYVIRRLVAPPALPAVIGPWTAHRTEHVSTQDPGPDSRKAGGRKLVIRPGFPPFVPMHLLPGPCVEEPVEQFRPVDSERILQILIRSRTVPV